MCGKFTWMLSWREVHHLAGLTGGADSGGGVSEEDYRALEREGGLSKATPMGEAPILHLDRDGARTVTLMRWGWPKSFEAKDGRALHMHAVGETIDEKVTFAESFRMRRGIAWCTTFNEGEMLPNGKTRQWVCRDPGRRPLPIAVIFQAFPLGEGRFFPAFCMVTTKECAQLAAINVDRMPAILQSDADMRRWLGEIPATTEELKAALRPYEGELVIVPQDAPKPPGRKRPPPSSMDRPRLFD